MSPLVVTLIGLALLVLGIVSRRPWGRWWAGGGSLSEQFATLIAPPMGLAVLGAGVALLAGSGSTLYTAMGFIVLPSMLAATWTVLSLPVPDRVLVQGSSIRADRRRRRQRRQAKQGRAGEGDR